jgi:hypothetical protein
MPYNPQSGIKPSDTENYSGVLPPEPFDNGTLQFGGWANLDTPPFGVNVEVAQGVPAQVKISISGSGVTQVGAINQLAGQVSLASGTLQLTGHVYDAENNLTDPPLGTFVWISRNVNVATVNASGLVTLTGRGSCDIEARYSRAANLPFENASPSPTESMAVYATVNLTVTA